jgi:hypothetical protein
MPHTLELRLKAGERSPGDLVVTVQDKTYDYLLSSSAEEIRVSAYLDRDWPQVEAKYAELFVGESCPFESLVKQVIPGSRTRKNIALPCAMHAEEQLVVIVGRTARAPTAS